MFFGKKEEDHIEEEEIIESSSSRFGRNVTSIDSAKKELFYKHTKKDVVQDIKDASINGKNFYGHYHNGDEKGKPCLIDKSEITMEFFSGSTGTGKGVFLANKIVQNIMDGKGMIIIDPKKDDFAPAVAEKYAEQYGLEFKVASFPNNFGYSGINIDDTFLDISNKLIDSLDLIKSANPGVDYYRRNGRAVLKKVLRIFFDGDLGVIVKKDLKEIVKHFQHLKTDLEKQKNYEKEISKTKPNYNIIEKLEKRFFKTELVEKIYWSDEDIPALSSVALSLEEMVGSANIYNDINLDTALYNKGIIYIQIDMLDVSSLAMAKILITDAIQKGRRKKAYCNILGDEISFWCTPTLAGALATTRGFGLDFSLFAQTTEQIPEELRGAILTNCNLKFFYKPNVTSEIDMISKLSGKELVTNYSASQSSEYGISQTQEDELNTTRLRALPRTNVAVVIAEALNKAYIVQTNIISVEKPFDWSRYDQKPQRGIFDDIDYENITYKETDLANYKISIKEEIPLLEDSDLFALKFESEEI